MTNEELIKRLNTEELADWLVDKVICECCPLRLAGYCHKPNIRVRVYCRGMWELWLKSNNS